MKIKNLLLIAAFIIAVVISYNIGQQRIDFTGQYFDQVMLPFMKLAALWLMVITVAIICTLSNPGAITPEMLPAAKSTDTENRNSARIADTENRNTTRIAEYNARQAAAVAEYTARQAAAVAEYNARRAAAIAAYNARTK